MPPEIEPFGVSLTAPLILALRQAGRQDEARAMLLAASARLRRWQAGGVMDSDAALAAASLAALDDRPAEAIAALNTAIDRGWRGQSFDWARDPADDPVFSTLAGDPLFERVRARLKSLQARDAPDVSARLAEILSRTERISAISAAG